MVFGAYGGVGEMLFGQEPPAGAVALGNLMRSQWAAFAAVGDPGWPRYYPGRRMTRIFGDPPDVAGYPEQASRNIWDQHRFGVIDLNLETPPAIETQPAWTPRRPPGTLQTLPERYSRRKAARRVSADADLRPGRVRAGH